MASETIRLLKAAVGVETDVELARALGVERSTVAQWKRRGGVPERYLALIKLDEPEGQQRFTKAFNAIRHHVLGRAQNHYYLRAALAFMPENLPTPAGASRAQLGIAREFTVIRLMDLSQALNMLEHERRYCESEADYEELLATMEREGRQVIDRILAETIVPEVPQ